VRAYARERYRRDIEGSRARQRAYSKTSVFKAARRQRYRDNDGAAKRLEWDRANRERARERSRAQYQKHRAKWLADLRAKREANREAVNTAWRDWYARNLNARRAYERRARSLRRCTSEATEYREVLYCDPCSYCGGPAGSVDHIVSVATGGGNEWENFTAACKACNTSKHAELLVMFLQRRGA
jgi:5-methylcytosine-specific restriction endonuclease McrA